MDPAGWSEFLTTWFRTYGARLGALIVGAVLALLVLEWLYRQIFRRLARRSASRTDDRVFQAVHRAIRFTVVVSAIDVALRLVEAPVGVADIASRVGRSLIVIAWTVSIVSVLSDLLREAGTRGRISFLKPRSVPLFDTIQKVFLWGAATYMFFVTWNIDVTAWAASAGVIGIAVGFAAKDTLANLFSGVFILVDSPYRIGDMILLDSGERGRVTDVGIRSTRIVTRDDVEIIIPNSQIGAAKVTNESGGPYRKRRVDVRVSVGYGSDLARVRAALMAVAAEIEVVSEQPEPRIRFREMADSGLLFSLLFWIDDPEDRGRAIDAVNSAILERFRANGIEIPFPQRVVHLPSAPQVLKE